MVFWAPEVDHFVTGTDLEQLQVVMNAELKSVVDEVIMCGLHVVEFKLKDLCGVKITCDAEDVLFTWGVTEVEEGGVASLGVST